MPAPVAVDLFAGAGGLSLGAVQSGMQVAAAVEVDAWACETLETNGEHGRVVQADLTALGDDWIRRELPRYPDVLMGGPPCQGFSHAGVRTRDPKDPRNSLFREFVRVTRLLEPRAVLLENVPGLRRARTSTGEPVEQVILRELQALGYTVRALVLEAQDFGVPQLRPRLFFLGSLDAAPPERIPATHGDASLFGHLLPRVTLADALGDLPRVDVGFEGPLARYDAVPVTAYQAAMRAGAGDVVENHVPMRHAARSIERFKAIAPGQSQSDVPEALAPRPRLRPKDGPGVRYDQNNRRMRADRPCHTVPASFYANFLHPELHRNFTPREGARIQSFPDRYVFRGKRTVVSQKLLAREGRTSEQHLCQYHQIGNAVPPLLAHVAVEALLRGAASVSLAA